MYLSKLELFGFKSFANKTNLKFSDGIACVIGPNGSGKSNIVDAIRWVLGEQKVNTLRSDKMESVIFNGSKKRKPLGLAEVSLTIQNNKNILDSPFSEVVISRRLYRNGESQYLLNRTPCRLKDILGLFMDTGINANSYSVIELKMVESIISENPEERRVLFEEAAGVTKYKIRRKSALRKLNATKSDMSRISDMIAEITRSVNSLSRQVGKARRYLKFQDELKTKDTDLARYKYNLMQDEIHPLEKQLKEISVIKDDTSHQITLEETILEDYKQEIIQFEQKLSNINKQIFDYDKEIQTIQENEAVSRTRIESLQETKSRNIIDIEEFEIKQDNLKEKSHVLENDLKHLFSEIEKVEENYKIKFNEYEKLVDLNKSKKDKIDNLENEFKKVYDNLSSVKENRQNFIYKKQWNAEQIKNLNVELDEIKKNNNQSIVDIEDYENQKTKTNVSLNDKSKQIELLNKNVIQIDSDLENLSSNLNSFKSKEEIIESKIEFFKNVIENYEGHSESTKYLMQNKSSFSGLYGPLSDFISVDSKYNTAVEATLGTSINYLVVDNTTTALKLLDECKNNNLGRISVLPIDRIEKIKSEPIDTHLTILSKLIEAPTRYKSIYNILFGDVAVVADLDEALNALNALKDFPNLRFVTLNGETVNFNLGITGGNNSKNEDSLIGREIQLKNYDSEIKKIIKEIDNLNSELIAKQKEKKELQEKLKFAKIEHEEIAKKLISIKQNISQMTFVKENRISTKNAKASELQSIQSKIKQIELQIENDSKQVEDLSKQVAKFENEIKLQSADSEKETEYIDIINKDAQEIKFNLLNKQNNFQLKDNDFKRIKETLTELIELIEKRSTENKNIVDEIEDKNLKSTERQKQKEQIYEQRDKIDSEKENFEVKYHEIRDKILHLENQIKKYRKQHDSSLERTRQLELNIQENKMKSEVIKDKIREEYNIDISIGIPFEGINSEEYEQDIETLKYKIKQLGQVNPLAVNEYDTESKRLEFFTKQYDDLEQAIDSLQKTIDKINLTARKQFKETFELIKTNFEKVFSSFFVNGEGSLALEEGVDPLEADIDIFVRPKGRRVQTLNLLSGGEKTLTAISLLFAIYLVKPSPFCILDEIDAPLDDVNIKRFTDALHNFSNDTQFIVITHNKRTMEAADTLYGVTMEEEGLSKLVSVKFN
jgi:chromosome segregation protein